MAAPAALQSEAVGAPPFTERLLRLAVLVPVPLPQLPHPVQRPVPADPFLVQRPVLEDWVPAPVYDFAALSPGQTIAGPAIVESDMTTVLLRAVMAASGQSTTGQGG